MGWLKHAPVGEQRAWTRAGWRRSRAKAAILADPIIAKGSLCMSVALHSRYEHRGHGCASTLVDAEASILIQGVF